MKLNNDNPVCGECNTTYYQLEQLEALKKENQRLQDENKSVNKKLRELRTKCGRAMWDLRKHKINELVKSISKQN